MFWYINYILWHYFLNLFIYLICRWTLMSSQMIFHILWSLSRISKFSCFPTITPSYFWPSLPLSAIHHYSFTVSHVQRFPTVPHLLLCLFFPLALFAGFSFSKFLPSVQSLKICYVPLCFYKCKFILFHMTARCFIKLIMKEPRSIDLFSFNLFLDQFVCFELYFWNALFFCVNVFIFSFLLHFVFHS